MTSGEGFLSEAARFPDKTYPVDSWNPTLCGEMDIVIRKDGAWLHEGRPITRPALVRLFAKLLRCEGNDYFLVTPAEKLKITVEDLPLRIVDFEGPVFMTDQDERVTLGADHLLVFDRIGDAYLPRLRVRGNLWGRLTRACTYRLFEMAEIVDDGCVRVSLSDQTFDVPVISG
ncbi:DUF1285 domain-containing protein [Asticcacaulis sp. YBE204]|uniref:DUF1285 domain-containing protein n=1 Tax=Asticcacaulis sp. YBE204 TaxID=1282363 RepID=UPI0003C3EBA4|nr:DUF1285 domain-containing protein [Asticcacaulis sp. YBE204]ESQ77495.1 hypothetical protein AEYBE204_17295 [Asticcacaulis sp. YBE204]